MKACFFIGRSYGLERRGATHWTKMKDLLDYVVGPKGSVFPRVNVCRLHAFGWLLESTTCRAKSRNVPYGQ